MAFPIPPPIEPMLAKPTPSIPEGPGWIYEPKWDGFRALVFRDGPEVHVQSRDLKPLNRYFPEILEPLRAAGGSWWMAASLVGCDALSIASSLFLALHSKSAPSRPLSAVGLDPGPMRGRHASPSPMNR